MTAYWDSSALIIALSEQPVRERLLREGGITRSHALCEVFSTLTGGKLGMRVETNEAVLMIGQLAAQLEIVDLQLSDLLDALSNAKRKGVRGGRVYDYIHSATAVHFSCDRVYTLNFRDFENLFNSLEILAP